MRKVLALCLALVCAGVAFGEGLEPLMAPGDIAVNAGLGYGFFWGAIDVSGGAEYIIGQFTIADVLPFTYGVAAKASYYSTSASSWGDYRYAYFGGGVFGTLHFGLKDVALPDNLGYLRNVDTFIGIGGGFYDYSYPGYDESYDIVTKHDFKVGFRSTAGVAYFITPKLAIITEGGYYGYYSSGVISVLVKL